MKNICSIQTQDLFWASSTEVLLKYTTEVFVSILHRDQPKGEIFS